ncbi:uncharacterized protein LOC116211518 [Punica granatum]|uniref:Uncharacterized protein n=2 Tax=Punica granatum TaxID=22663 RepID=A0A2I0L8V0_PUNGR|nr:uncharacterized protein LOC116211518 [Punica granatum]PKI77124.1 hypothetical protein CRG98_002627 [Punica granatum]
MSFQNFPNHHWHNHYRQAGPPMAYVHEDESFPNHHGHNLHHHAGPPAAYVYEEGERGKIAPARAQMAYEYERTPSWNQEEKRNSIAQEDVDREAEEFILIEHKKFERNRGLTMKNG